MRRSASTCGINDVFITDCDLISCDPVINHRINEDRKNHCSKKNGQSMVHFISTIIDDIISNAVKETIDQTNNKLQSNGLNGHFEDNCDISVNLSEGDIIICTELTSSDETLSDDSDVKVVDPVHTYVLSRAVDKLNELQSDTIVQDYDINHEDIQIIVDESSSVEYAHMRLDSTTSESTSRIDSNASSRFNSMTSDTYSPLDDSMTSEERTRFDSMTFRCSDTDDTTSIPYDSCPSDSTEDEFDDSKRLSYSFPSEKFTRIVPPIARRGRLSVITPPNMFRSEREKPVTIKKYKSEGALDVLRDDFVDHLKSLNQGTRKSRSPSTIKLELLTSDNTTPTKGHRRVNSQSITKEEIDIVKLQVKDKKMWDFHKMANKSKLAHAILFIGARYAAIAQEKFAKLQIENLNNKNTDEDGDKIHEKKERNRDSFGSEKGSKLKGAKSTSNIAKESLKVSNSFDDAKEGKTKLTRAFSFSFKPKTNLSKATSVSTVSLRTDSKDQDHRRSSENDVCRLYKKRGSGEDGMQALAEEDMVSMRARRCLSWQELSMPADQDISSKGPRKALSSEGLSPKLPPGSPDLKRSFDYQQYSQTPQVTQSQFSLNRKLTGSSSSLLEDDEDLDSNSEDEKKSRITRLRSIAVGKSLKQPSLKRERKSVSFMRGKAKHTSHLYQTLEQEHGLDVVCGVCRVPDLSFTGHLQRCTNCDYVAHKACSMQGLDQCPHRDKEKKSNKTKITWNSSKPVALLNKRQPSNTDLRELPNNSCRRNTIKDSEGPSRYDNRSCSISDSHTNLFRGTNRSQSPGPLPLESEEEFSDDDSDTINSWRETIDPAVLANMRKEEMKRQDHIHELITTERNHITNLKILIKVFKSKLQSKLNISNEDCTNLFPSLETMLHNCTHLYTQLKEGMLIPNHKFGEILVQHFSPDTSEGDSMRDCYSRLSAQKTSAVDLYKEKCKDKNFREIAAYLESKKVCKRQTYSELILAVTMRLTKYPPMLEALVRSTPSSHPDHDTLKQAVDVVKDALSFVNAFVKKDEHKKMLEIYKSKLEIREIGNSKSYKLYRNFDLCLEDRALIHRGQLTLKYSDKAIKVLVLLFNDYLVILREKDNKLQLSFDEARTSPIINLSDCIIKDITSDKLTFVVISEFRNDPQMYSFIASCQDSAEDWVSKLNVTKNLIKDKKPVQVSQSLPTCEQNYLVQSKGESSDSDTDSVKRAESVQTIFTSEDDSRSSDFLPDVTMNSFFLEGDKLDKIEEKREFFKEYTPCNTRDHIQEVERLQQCVRKCPSFHKTVRSTPIKEGIPARRATSLLLVERQRKEENRRHTTCLTQQEMSTITNQYTKTLQDNPVRQKSSDSGCCVEDPQLSVLNSMSVLRNALLHVLKKDSEQEALIKSQSELIAQQKVQLDLQSQKITTLESKIVECTSETNLLRSEMRILTSRLDHSPVVRRHRSLNVVEEMSDSQTSV